MNSTQSRLPLILKILAGYCVLVTLFFVAQTVLDFAMPSYWRADTLAFVFVLLLGLAMIPVWWLRPRWLPVLLTLWWLPQLIVVTLMRWQLDGSVESVPEWRVILLLFAGPNIEFRAESSVSRLYHLNMLALVALVVIFSAGIRSLLAGPKAEATLEP